MPPTVPPLTGAVLAAALLLLATGTVKIARPDPTAAALVQAGVLRGARVLARFVGVAELLVGLAVLMLGGPVPAAALALAYLAFTGFVVLALRQPQRIRTCGCAGTDAPPTVAHAAVNVVLAGCALAAVATGQPSLAGVFATAGLAEGAALLAFAALTALLAWAVVAVLPAARPVRPAPSSPGPSQRLH